MTRLKAIVVTYVVSTVSLVTGLTFCTAIMDNFILGVYLTMFGITGSVGSAICYFINTYHTQQSPTNTIVPNASALSQRTGSWDSRAYHNRRQRLSTTAAGTNSTTGRVDRVYNWLNNQQKSSYDEYFMLQKLQTYASAPDFSCHSVAVSYSSQGSNNSLSPDAAKYYQASPSSTCQDIKTYSSDVTINYEFTESVSTPTQLGETIRHAGKGVKKSGSAVFGSNTLGDSTATVHISNSSSVMNVGQVDKRINDSLVTVYSREGGPGTSSVKNIGNAQWKQSKQQFSARPNNPDDRKTSRAHSQRSVVSCASMGNAGIETSGSDDIRRHSAPNRHSIHHDTRSSCNRNYNHKQHRHPKQSQAQSDHNGQQEVGNSHQISFRGLRRSFRSFIHRQRNNQLECENRRRSSLQQRMYLSPHHCAKVLLTPSKKRSQITITLQEPSDGDTSPTTHGPDDSIENIFNE